MTWSGPTENETCASFVRPAIARAGWTANQVVEQYVVLAMAAPPLSVVSELGDGRVDYVLEYEPGVPLVAIEAKRLWAHAGTGLQQAMRYASMLDAPFAMSTNGTGWKLHNRLTGTEHVVDDVPTPVEAWDLYSESQGLNAQAKDLLLSRFSDHHRGSDGSVRRLRYYQRRAIHDVLVSLTNGERRLLLVMATGTGKTFTAMQLVWKLWNYRRHQQLSDNSVPNYRVLYLADRNVLVKDPLNKTFALAFGEAAVRVSSKNIRHSPDIYFATYQALDADLVDSENDTGEVSDLLSNYPADFFDLVIVDECHRGSAREDSAWRGILEHFSSAAQLGLTATPVERGTADTFGYFGNPLYEYSLRQGIEDGFLAPYTIRQVQFDVDVNGLEIVEGMVDTAGRDLPAGTYTTRDFERTLQLPDRTLAMARVIDRVIGDSGDRAVIFCVDSVHALCMLECLHNLRPQRTRENPEWVARIMTAERDKDRLLEQFTDPERDTPQIAVTTRLLSTGVDIQDLKYVIIARTIGSVPEFKQIIGRGTRLYPDKDKYEFEILDFVGATSKFSDSEFDGPPLKPPVVELVDEAGNSITPSSTGQALASADADDDRVEEPEPEFRLGVPAPMTSPPTPNPTPQPRPAKFELRGIEISLHSEGFWVHDVASGKPRLVSYTDWAKEQLLASFADPNALLAEWADPTTRSGVIRSLRGAHIDLERLARELGIDAGSPIDTVDQLVQLAWNVPSPTRAERASSARVRHYAELELLSDKAREVLEGLLEIYATRGIEEMALSAILQVPPLSEQGTPSQIAQSFGGAPAWHQAHADVQQWLYIA